MDQVHLLGLFRNAGNKAQQIGLIGVGGITGHRMNMRVDFHFSSLNPDRRLTTLNTAPKRAFRLKAGQNQVSSLIRQQRF